MKTSQNVKICVILLGFLIILAATASAETLPDVHFFASSGGTFYVVNEALGMYLSVNNFNEAKNFEIRTLHPDLRGGKDYVGADGRYYVIYDNFYKRTSNLQTNAESAKYSLHSKFQGGKHYFSNGKYFYMVTADGKKYRRTTNMNKASEFKEYTIHRDCQNGDFYFATDENYYFAKISEGKYHRVDNFNEGKSHRQFTIAQDVLNFVKKRPQALDVADVHFLATDGGPYVVVNEDIGVYMTVDNFHYAKALNCYTLHEQVRGGRDYVATEGRYYIIYDNYYRRTTSLSSYADSAQYTLHEKFKGGKHYFAIGEHFYMIPSDGKSYRRTTNMNTAADFEEFSLHGECQKGDYYFSVTGAYYFVDIKNGLYHKIDNLNKNSNHRQYPIHTNILKFITQKSSTVNEKIIQVSSASLSNDDKALFEKNRQDYSYTFYQDSSNAGILTLFGSKSKNYGIKVVKAVEENGVVNVYVEETWQGNVPSTTVKLHTTNPKVVVKDVKGRNYYYFTPRPMEVTEERKKWIKLAIEYAPLVYLFPGDISYPSSVEGIVNRSYKVRPLPRDDKTLTTGVLPELAINDAGVLLEIHRTSSMNSKLSYDIHYRIGTVQDDNSIKMVTDGHKYLTTGVNPSIAINNQNFVVEAHEHSRNDEIDLRYGSVNFKDKEIKFTNKSDFTFGKHPSVAINDDNIFIMVNERNDGKLEYHFGRLTDSGITFYKTKEIIRYHGTRPSVAINKHGQVILAYEDSSKIKYMIGQVMTDYNIVAFGEPINVSDGKHPSIALNDNGDVIEIHQTSSPVHRKNPNDEEGLFTMLHYRYGELRMNGVGRPYVEFSQHIELCSGENSDIVLNNRGDVVEIHETYSVNNNLQYRVLSGNNDPKTKGYYRQVVTSLNDLPKGESGLIIVQYGNESWEGQQSGIFNLKTYATVKEVEGKIVIGYYFFYPKNGTDMSGMDTYYHIGDWERIYVTLDSATDKVLGYRYHYHSHEKDYKKSEVYHKDGTHPIVFSALETHASYPSLLDVSFGDIINPIGDGWSTWENDDVEVVLINTEDLKWDNSWSLWCGVWGSTLNSPKSKLWE